MRKFILIIAMVAALIRLFNLTLPPLFFDESIHATILKSLFNGNYRYNPAYHGPLLYYLLYTPVQTLGESEFSLRILPALTGILVALTPLLYRRFIGSEAAIIAAVLVAISAIITNYSRFCREDIFQLLFTALFAYFIFRYLEKEKSLKDLRVDRDTLLLTTSFIFMALLATLKETFYPIAAVFALYFIFDIKKFRASDLAISASVFLLIYFAFYTNFFTYTTPLTNFSEFPAVKAVSYWKHQHDIARIGGPWYYYLELILLYDFPAFLLAIFALHAIIIKRNNFEAFTAYWFLSFLILFSYIQEKVPWLGIHILFPMYILTGIAIVRLNSKLDRRKLKTLAAVCILFSAYGSVHVNHINPVNPAEPALYLPTQYDVREFAEKTRGERIYIFTEIGEYWPLAWYLREHKAYFITTGIEGWNFREGDYVVVNITNDMKIDKTNLEFVETMVVRCWTFWTTPQLQRVPEFIVLRKPLNDISCMNFSVYRANR